jgi:hypothetical protein
LPPSSGWLDGSDGSVGPCAVPVVLPASDGQAQLVTEWVLAFTAGFVMLQVIPLMRD